MVDETTPTPGADSSEHVTIIREGRSSGGMIVAVLALVIIALVAIWALNSNGDRTDSSVAAAADKVGSAAEKVGNAAENAGERLNQ